MEEDLRSKERVEAQRKEFDANQRRKEDAELQLERAFDALSSSERKKRVRQARASLRKSSWLVKQSKQMGIDLEESVIREAVRRFGLEKGASYLT